MTPAQFNDGYTVELHGCLIRPMTKQASSEVFQLTRDGQVEQSIQNVFCRPQILSGSVESLTEQQQRDIWKAIVEYPEEDSDLENLISGIKLRVSNPRASDYSCDTCRKWVTDYDNWRVSVRPGGVTLTRNGGELLCETQAGCIRGTWQNPKALNQKNTSAWNHYWEFRLAGMPLPECPIQRRNWKLISWVCDYATSREFRPTVRPTA